MGKKIFLISHLNLSCFSLFLLFLIIFPCFTVQGLDPPPWCHPIGTQGGCSVCQKLSLSQAARPHSLLLLLTEQVLQFPKLWWPWTHPWLWVFAWEWVPKTASPLFCNNPHWKMQISGKWKTPLQCCLPFGDPAPKPRLSAPKRTYRKPVQYNGKMRAPQLNLAHISRDRRLIKPLCLIFISQTMGKGGRRVSFFLLHFFVLAWTAASFSWALSFLIQYDFESHSFSSCFAWL